MRRAQRSKRFSVLVVLCTLVGATVAVAPPSGAGDLPSQVINLEMGRNTRGPRADHGLIVFVTSEGHEQRDLNGDGIVGDTNTQANQVFDVSTGVVHNLAGSGGECALGTGVHLPNVRFDDETIAYAVSEGSTKIDLNGDADQSDYVMHVWTLAGGVVNLGFDIDGSGCSASYAVGGGKVVFAANERELHPELIAGSQDLNGDGDALDTGVVLVWDEATGTVSQVGDLSPAGTALIAEHDGLFVWQGEPGQVDSQYIAYDAATGTTAACCGSTFNGTRQVLDVRDGIVGMAGNLGAASAVRFWSWDVAGASFTASGVVADLTSPIVAMDNGFFAFAAPEAVAGPSETPLDLNGDGDTLDDVLHLWDPVGVTAVNSGLAFDRSFEVRSGSDVVAFVVDEAEQGADLNGDGDTSSDDRILHVWQAGDPAPTNTLRGLTADAFAVDGSTVVFSVTQDPSGAAVTRRVHTWTPTGGVVDRGVNAALVTSDVTQIRASEGQFSLIADEMATGADLDGDGLMSDPALDVVPTVWDPVNGLWHVPDPGRVFPTWSPGFSRSHAMFEVAENPTATDLNCDGDISDAIMHVSALGSTPAPTPCGFPVVTPGNAILAEGDVGSTVVQLPVTLSGPSAFPVTVDWTTLDTGGPGVATADVDYVADSGTLTFPPGSTSETIDFTINADLADEVPALYGEWMLVSFSNPSANASVGGFFGFGIVIIVDDDPTPVITAGGAIVAEGDVGTVTVDVPVSLSNPSQRTITVDWTTYGPGGNGAATEDVDYVGDSGTLTFVPGDTTEMITVTVNGDTIDEPPAYLGEWGFIALSNAANATISTGGLFGFGLFIIVDDDP